MIQKKYVALLFVMSPLWAWAQGMQWGSGQWGGMQSCPYQQRTGDGATSENDELQELLAEIDEIKSQIKIKKSEVKNLDRKSQRSRQDVEESLSSDYSSFILAHIENNTRCSEYQGMSANPAVQGSQGEEPIAGAQDNMLPVQGFTTADWAKYCDRSKTGSVNASVCSNAAYLGDDHRKDAMKCKKALTDYRKQYADSQKLQNEIESLQRSLEDRKQDLADLKRDIRQEQREGGTQAEYCEECNRRGSGYAYQKPQTDWGSVISNVGTGLLATYMGYKSNQMVAEQNADLGYPTQNYPAWGYGLPYLQAGIYGALGGSTGQGSFGCGGGNNMMSGGAFGYPMNMMGSPMGGGMFLSGMTPWGMNGYGGMNGMGMMGNMGMMMPGGMMMSGGLGMMTGMGMMSNMGMMSGMMMNGGLGMMTGMGMMSNMGMMGGMGLMSNYGMMSNMGMMSNYGMMTGMDSSSMAMQQQMLQMQMQYYQNYSQQQMAKYQTMSSLQTELYSLMNRIQQVQYSSNYSGMGIGSSYYNNYNNSYGAIPAPSSGSYYSNGVLAAPGSSYYDYNSSGVIPAPSTTTTTYGR